MKRLIIPAVLLAVASLPGGASAGSDACELAGVNDGGGFIDCAGVTGPARIVAVDDYNHPTRLTLLVNDEQEIAADVYTNPDGSVFAVVLEDADGLLAFGMTRAAVLPGGIEVPSSATASYNGSLDLYAPCTFELDAGPHWCR